MGGEWLEKAWSLNRSERKKDSSDWRKTQREKKFEKSTGRLNNNDTRKD